MTSLIEFFTQWLDNIEENEITLFIINKSDVTGLINIALQNNKVKFIKCFKTNMKDKKIIKYNSNIDTHSYMFIDFVDPLTGSPDKSLGVKKDQDITYFFNRPLLKRYVISFLFFNYNGQRPINNFWIPDDYNYDNFVSFKRSTWAKMSQELNSGKSTGDNLEKDLSFRNDFKKYISTILKYIINEEYIFLFIDEKYMGKWIQSITHFTYNNLYNYESLEFDGDAISKFSFRDYMIKKYPLFIAHELSEYSNQYMSRTFQSIFSDDLLLTSWMLYDPIIKDKIKTNEKIKTDILESFTGALKEIGNDIEDGIGIVVCCNLYTILGESLPFPKYMAYGTYLTQVIQMNEKMGFSKSNKEGDFYDFHEKKNKAFIIKMNKVEVEGATNINNNFTLGFNPIFLQFLKDNGIDTTLLENTFNVNWKYVQIFNNDEKESKKEANDEIYSQIYKIYSQIGITQEFSSNINRKDIFAKIGNFDRTLINRLKQKVGEEDSKRINFSTDNNLHIIIMFLDVLDLKYNKSGIESLSYNTDIKLEVKNLIVSDFFSSIPSNFTMNHNITNLEFSKWIAIKKYLGTEQDIKDIKKIFEKNTSEDIQ